MRGNAIHQKQGRGHTQRGVWASWVRSAVWRWRKSYRTVLLGRCLPLANYLLSSHLTDPWILPKMDSQIFAKMDPIAQAYGYVPHLLWGEVCSLFHPMKPSWACTDGEIFLALRHLIALFKYSSAFTTSFVLRQSGWEQKLSFTPLDSHQVSGPEANFSYLLLFLVCFKKKKKKKVASI